ncbi:MAG: class I adenylate-forming enzyme family protein, partial [Alphaproteobacteria bacterium]
MFHSADLLGTGFTLLGAAHAFMPQFTPVNVLQAIQEYRITFAMMAPTMVILVLQEPSFDRYDIASFRRLFYGSSPMAVEWIKRTLERFTTTEVEQGYGLTETAPILTVLPVADHLAALASGDHEALKSCGRSVPGLDLRVVDDEGREMPTGDAGEVVVRGPNVTPGYLNLPDINRSTFTDGWFHTGDVGKFDARGNLYLLDRKKDMVITGGENVYTSEVEAAIYQHPAVFEAAVFGVPDDTYGEALFAAVVVAPGKTLTAEELIAHCRGKIGGYKIPRRYAFLAAMPKSAMGKILKTELRRSYGGGAQKKAS